MTKTERELGAALLQLEAADLGSVPGEKQQTWRILDRDRRRLRWWTALAILAWLPAVLGVLGVLIYLGFLFPLQAHLKQIRDAQRAGEVEPGDVYLHNGRELNLAELERDAEIGFKMMSVLTGFSVLALCGATLFSILLISASRRATLRQINANLLEIAQQLKRGRPGEPDA